MKTILIALITLVCLASCQKEDDTVPVQNEIAQIKVEVFGTDNFILGWRTSDLEEGFWNKNEYVGSTTLVFALHEADTLEVGGSNVQLKAYVNEKLTVEVQSDGYLQLKIPN